MKITPVFIILFILTLIEITHAQNSASDPKLSLFLKKFHANPARAMSELPKKYNLHGEEVKPKSSFTHEEIKTKKYITIKDSYRKSWCKNTQAGKRCKKPFINSLISTYAARPLDEDINAFMPGFNLQTTIEATSRPALATGEPLNKPWSGDYWATYKGGIAARYLDPAYPTSSKFSDLTKYLDSNPFKGPQDKKTLSQLSPSEKYDLLMRDNTWTLTKTVLQDCKTSAVNDKIETWFGICHGWAAAAYMVPRPKKAVSIPIDSSGNVITFLPDDLKALISHAWAHGYYQSQTLGGRCNDKNPKTDRNGRVLSEDCFDINPATWHIALINQVGIARKSFVIDATYDYEVWNQPIVSYKLNYFNVRTQAQSANVNDVILPISEHTKDPYKKYRSPLTAKIVGVAVDLVYSSEITASAQSTDSESNDNYTTVQYIYDVEIDSVGNLIGGEWYQTSHPDFVWTPYDDEDVSSAYDTHLKGIWSGDLPPADWTKYAQKASQRNQPLGKVLKQLVKMAQ